MNNDKSEIDKIFDLAIKDHKENKFDTALNSYNKILDKDEYNLKALFYLGTLYLQIKKFEEAKKILTKLIKVNSEISDAHNNLGVVFQELDELENAKNSFKNAIKLNPKHIDAYNNLGAVYKKLGEYEKSEFNIKKSLEFNPKYANAYNNLALLYKKFEEFDKSEKYFKKAFEINPRLFTAYDNLMEQYEKTNQDEKLEELIIKTNEIFQNDKTVKLYRGKLLYKKELHHEAIEILNSFLFDEKDKELEINRTITLAKSYDYLDKIDQAFKYFKKANDLNFELKKDKIKKDNFLREISLRDKFYSKLSKISCTINDQKKNNLEPLFMIGFPRSGTTLLDTILRSHSSIEVIEEKPILSDSINSLIKSEKGSLETLQDIDNDGIVKIREEYYKKLKSYVPEYDASKIYINKLPLNIIYVGEVLRIFPKAKFIFSIRHPNDCVLSCFMQNFELNDAMSNFLDLKDSAKLYNSVMSLWLTLNKKFSINLHEIRYEKLVSDSKTEIKSVLEFLELPWEDALIDYQKTAKKRKWIFTPSYDQVIKPIYSKSSGRWVRYEKYISDILPILKPWIKKLGYD